ENGLITVFCQNQLRQLTRTIGTLLMWLATHIEEDLPRIRKVGNNSTIPTWKPYPMRKDLPG
ncbi:MAG: hypothetical protein VX675_03085, partial [Planctomycetota bacterium]|nr:hypothetical protein [Planctomycetota bacterium]